MFGSLKKAYIFTINNFFPAATSSGQLKSATEDLGRVATDAGKVVVDGASLGTDVVCTGAKVGTTTVAVYHAAPVLHAVNTGTALSMMAFSGTSIATVLGLVNGVTQSVLLMMATNPLLPVACGVIAGLLMSRSDIADGAERIANIGTNVVDMVKGVTTATAKAAIGGLVAVKEYLDPVPAPITHVDLDKLSASELEVAGGALDYDADYTVENFDESSIEAKEDIKGLTDEWVNIADYSMELGGALVINEETEMAAVAA